MPDRVHLYPDEFATPNQKELASYGLDYVRAMYYSSNRHGSRIFEYSDEFDSLIDFAQGRQSVTDLRKIFGYGDQQTKPEYDGPESLMYLDIRVLNIIPKYVNRAVAKMQRLNYDIQLAAIDILHIDKAKDLESAIDAYYRLKPWLDSVQIDAQELFPELDVASMPKYKDEFMFKGTVNPMIRAMISGEKIVKLIHEINNTREKMRQVCWDIVVVGRGHVHCFFNQNMRPSTARIHPKYYMGAYVDNEDYNSQENAGFIEFITVNQFRKEAYGKMKESDIREIVDHFSHVNQVSNSIVRSAYNFDGLSYIPVLRFYFLSNDVRTFRIGRNSYNNPDYRPVGRGHQLQDGQAGRVVETQYTSCYGGTWVIDSDVVYDYGRKNYPRTNLVDMSLPIKTFAPNAKDGKITSFTAQLIEPAFMVNVAWNKIKEILAKGWMGQREIDFTQLESVALGRANRQWTPREVFEYGNMSNTWVKRSRSTPHGQNFGNAVEEMRGGLQLADYFTTFNTGIQMMESLSGQSLVEQFNVPDRLGLGVQEASAAAGDIDMEWLYNAHDEMWRQVSHQLILMAQEAKRSGVRLSGMIPWMGGMEWFEMPEEAAYSELGIYIKRLHNEAMMWQEFFLDARDALKTGQITLGDMAFLRNISNVKEAQQMLAIRAEQNMRKAAEMRQEDQQAALVANAQAAQLKTQGVLQQQDQQGKIDMEIEKLKGDIQGRLKMIDKQIEGQAKQYSDQIKLLATKQAGMDKMLSQAMENRSNETIQQMQEATQMAKIASDERKAEKEPKGK